MLRWRAGCKEGGEPWTWACAANSAGRTWPCGGGSVLLEAWRGRDGVQGTPPPPAGLSSSPVLGKRSPSRLKTPGVKILACPAKGGRGDLERRAEPASVAAVLHNGHKDICRPRARWSQRHLRTCKPQDQLTDDEPETRPLTHPSVRAELRSVCSLNLRLESACAPKTALWPSGSAQLCTLNQINPAGPY